MPISATGFLPAENNAGATTPTITNPGLSTGAASTTSPLNTGDVGSGKSSQQVCMFGMMIFFIVLSQTGKNDNLCMLEDIYLFLSCCVCLFQTTISKAVNSLKVLAELPIIVVLMYQVSNKSALGSFGRLLWSSAGRRYFPGSNLTLLVAPTMNNNC